MIELLARLLPTFGLRLERWRPIEIVPCRDGCGYIHRRYAGRARIRIVRFTPAP